MTTDKNITIVSQKDVTAAGINLRSDGIIHINFKQIEELTPAYVYEIFESVKEMGGGKKYPTLITVKKHMYIGEETRKIWADGKKNCYSSAEAMILYNIAIKLIGNFFIQFHKPERPTRMFDNEEKGIEWLLTR